MSSSTKKPRPSPTTDAPPASTRRVKAVPTVTTGSVEALSRKKDRARDRWNAAVNLAYCATELETISRRGARAARGVLRLNHVAMSAGASDQNPFFALRDAKDELLGAMVQIDALREWHADDVESFTDTNMVDDDGNWHPLGKLGREIDRRHRAFRRVEAALDAAKATVKP